MFPPTEDRSNETKSRLLQQITTALGGRAAEEFIFKDVSTGASNDMEVATGIARDMVTQYGMSDKLGPLTYGERESQVFMGRDWGGEQPSPKAILEAARLWTKPGGLIALLHILVPARPKWSEREAIIGVLSGPHNVIRCLSVYRVIE